MNPVPRRFDGEGRALVEMVNMRFDKDTVSRDLAATEQFVECARRWWAHAHRNSEFVRGLHTMFLGDFVELRDTIRTRYRVGYRTWAVIARENPRVAGAIQSLNGAIGEIEETIRIPNAHVCIGYELDDPISHIEEAVSALKYAVRNWPQEGGATPKLAKEGGEWVLWYESIRCRTFGRRTSNQLLIIKKFEDFKWIKSIPNPLSPDANLKQCIKDLNDSLESGSPIRFTPDGSRALWSLRGFDVSGQGT